jgi:hypothetical protein
MRVLIALVGMEGHVDIVKLAILVFSHRPFAILVVEARLSTFGRWISCALGAGREVGEPTKAAHLSLAACIASKPTMRI